MNNGGAGVFVDDSAGATSDVTIRGNSSHSNTLESIALGIATGTPNDVGDADVGPNALQNAPVIDATGTDADGIGNTSQLSTAITVPVPEASGRAQPPSTA